MSVQTLNEKSIISRNAALTGIFVNIILCFGKIILGFISNSIAVISDGFNNLSDIGNAVFVYLSYKLAEKPADKQHPYGHGRLEYMMSQAISIMIIAVGISLLMNCIDRLINPKEVVMMTSVVIALIISLAVKMGLAWYYHSKYLKCSITTLKAQTADSLSDAAGTAVILFGYLINPHISFPLDSMIGILLSLMIIIGGLRIFIQMASLLVGQRPEEELFDKINGEILSYDQVKGVHDLMMHTYGAGQIYGSADIELDENLSFRHVHEITDDIENRIFSQFGVRLTVHADPFVEEGEINELRDTLANIINSISPRISFHDLHYNKALNKYLVDIVMPYDCAYTEQYVEEKIIEKINDSEGIENLEIRLERK